MRDMGFPMNLILPVIPMYLLLHPADQRRITYSPANVTTITISCWIVRIVRIRLIRVLQLRFSV